MADQEMPYVIIFFQNLFSTRKVRAITTPYIRDCIDARALTRPDRGPSGKLVSSERWANVSLFQKLGGTWMGLFDRIGSILNSIYLGPPIDRI